MNLARILVDEYRLGLKMLRDCVARCPDDLWMQGTHPRTFWRIAYHAAYFTDRYLQESAKGFQAWDKHVESLQNLWGKPKELPMLSREEVLEYVDILVADLERRISETDLDATKSGFPLYKMGKAELQILNLRHLQHHVGQLSELLLSRGIDIEWAGMA